MKEKLGPKTNPHALLCCLPHTQQCVFFQSPVYSVKLLSHGFSQSMWSCLIFAFPIQFSSVPVSTLVNFIASVVINFCRETWLNDLVVNSSGVIKETYMLPKLPQSCPILCDPMDCSLPGSSVTGMGCYALLQGIFPTQGSNSCLLCLLPWQAGSLPQGNTPKRLIWSNPDSAICVISGK